MSRILIIGGTGMLREATEYFISNNYSVSVLGQDKGKLNYFTEKFPDKTISLISQDYNDSGSLINLIEADIKLHGSFDIIISWIHSKASDSVRQLFDTLSKYNSKTRFYHVKGSVNYTPNNSDKLDYREILLGFVIENNSSRWLTNHEISEGVINTVVSDKKKSIVGQIEPEDLRP
jgi:hypothetical protein